MYGWMIWSGLRHILDMMQTGFSIAIFGIGARASAMKKLTADCCRPSMRFSAKCRAPLTLRCVHGGCAIIKSHG